jgi:hypothetical protein
MNCSIRKSALTPAIGLIGLLMAGGCQLASPQQPDRTNPVAVIGDDAMRARDWDQTNAVYPNFSTNVGPSEVLLVPDDRLPSPIRGAVETPLFLADIVVMPYAMVINPPWTQVEGSSLYVLPSYTANPPLVPGPGDDLSGGPGTNGYNAAPGRVVSFPSGQSDN